MQARTKWTRVHIGGWSAGLLARSLILSAALAGIGACSNALAGFTAIDPPPSYESTQAGIFDHIYGGSFTLEGDGVDYSNGTLTAVRVADSLPSSSTADSPGPDGTDQLWQASQVEATALASFATVPTSPFGYIEGASGGSFQPVFNVTGTGFNVTGSGSFTPGSEPFRFAAENPFGILSSSPADNADGNDHIVTYELDGQGGSAKTWLLFFDDYGNMGCNPDFDYQDLVIQVQTLPTPATSSVPEPGGLMLLGGVAIGLLKRVRRSKSSRSVVNP
jgi:hypothetical protein